MYEDQTFDVILQRMLSRVPETMDKRESSPIYAALAPAAVELTSMYIAFDCMLAETFGDTASREYLIRLCADRGITPKKATQAVLELETDVEIADGKRFTGGENTYRIYFRSHNCEDHAGFDLWRSGRKHRIPAAEVF